MAYEVITTTDKAKRDEMFQDLKRNGNHMERQVVKFSGSEPVLDPGTGKQALLVHSPTDLEWEQLLNPSTKILTPRQHKRLATKVRGAFQSTWSVAYPATPDVKPTRRARLRRMRDSKIKEEGYLDNLKGETV